MPCRFSLLCACLSSSVVLYSLPEQGAVAAGTVEIVRNNDQMQITASDRSILNWDSFSIDKIEVLQFVQPTNQSAVLNRVIGLTESRIDGKLLANGHVYLINPNGLIFGKDAVINTASFVGTTLQISNEDFLNNTELLFQGDSAASIVNLGTIECSEGPVTLIAHKIDNQGRIQSNESVSLIAGHEILLSSSHDLLHIRPDIKAEGIENSGVIEALQVRIENDGLQNLGVKQIDKPNASKIVTVGGKILLRAEESPVAVSGELIAEGGSVHILGETVHIMEGASIDVSGIDGGGEILIGGDYQGSNPDIPNALISVVDENVLLKADAIQNGDGGKVIVWSDKATFYRGHSYVRGGKEGGNGGLTEVSGKFLDFRGRADSTAKLGKIGTLLLDPTDITIGTGDSGYTFNLAAPMCGVPAMMTDYVQFPVSVASASIDSGTLSSQLETNCVVVDTSALVNGSSTNGIITVDNTAVVQWDAETTLTLIADAFITVSGQIQNTNTATGFTVLSMINNATPVTTYAGITINTGGQLTTAGGDIWITGTGGSGTTGGDGVNISGTARLTTTNGGNISIIGTGGVGTGVNHGINISGTSNIITDTGTVTLSGIANGTGTGSGNGVVITSAFAPVIELSVSGAVNISGTGFASATGGDSSGCVIDGSVDALGGGGTITIIGVGGTGAGANTSNGISLSTFEVSCPGDLILIGTGGSGTTGVFDGISLNAETIIGDGGGIVSLIGIGGSGVGATSTAGVSITGGTGISGDTGALSIEGIGGSGAASNFGINSTGSTGINNNTGGITITGTGGGTGADIGISATGTHFGVSTSSLGDITIVGNGQGNGASGVVLDNGLINAGTTGILTITGNGAPGTGINNGIVLGTMGVTSHGGAVNLTGTAGGNAGNGVVINSGASGTIRVFGPGGPIMITGIGVGDTGTGVVLNGTVTVPIVETSTSGDIFITGTSGAGATSAGQGISFTGTSKISVLAAGSINLTGYGTSGTTGAIDGISFTGTSTVSTTTGDIIINGMGGTGAGVAANLGISSTGVTNITSTSGMITLTGVGGSSSGVSDGINASGAGANIFTVNTTASPGGVSLIGTGSGIGGSGAVLNNAQISTTGGGAISITGTGATNTGAGNGISFGVTTASTLSTDTGTIMLTGNAGANHHGILFNGTLDLGNTAASVFSGQGGDNSSLTPNHGVDVSAGAVFSLGTGSSVIFQNCNGGVNENGRNVGVLWAATAAPTVNTGSSFTFGTISGGTGIVSANSNPGVEFSTSLQVSPCTITFFNITGGDLNKATHNNSGIIIESGATLSASAIYATAITGGGAQNDNYGFEVDGTLGSAGSAQNILIAAVGGPSNGGSGNVGIYVSGTGTVQTGAGGSISLTGTGNMMGGASGANHGIQFDVGSTLNAAGGASTITMSGTGGVGATATDGVLINGAVTLNSSSLSFINCTGGSTNTAGNVGVLFAPSGFTGTSGSVSFNSIFGGTGNGQNYGVEISGNTGIQFTASPSAVAFSNVMGGDAGNATSNNAGVLIDSAASVIASSISATGVFGGAALNANYGFQVAGALGDSTVSENITIAATGGASATGNSNLGILVAGTAQIAPGGWMSFNGTGNIHAIAGGGVNHGVEFAAGSSLTAAAGAASTIIMTGIGGIGTGVGSANGGVLIEGAVTLNSSSLSFINCTGGSSSAGGNVGVLFSPSGFSGTSGSVFFDSISGGIQGGSNYGVEITGSQGIQFTASPSTISFSNITGGDAGNATSNNDGVFIDANVTIIASAISATAVSGGAALSNNYGFEVAGTLGDSTVSENIVLAATGGASTTGDTNIGIFVTGTVQIAPAGLIALTGSGNTQAPTGGGANHGIQFAAGSALTATVGTASIITLTGTGGMGTGIGSASNGVLIQEVVNLNSSSLSFINCTGGTSSAGGNDGVLFTPTSLASNSGAAVYFNSILGGTGGGSNYGVDISGGVGIPFTATPSTVTFSNITGGDAGAGTSNNAGVLIDMNTTVSAAIINATGITGGAALNDNYGFDIAGTLGQLGAPATISITASGGVGTGNNNIGIKVEAAGFVIIDSAGTLAFNGTGGGLITSGGANHGVNVSGTLNIGSTTAAAVAITGVAGAGATANDGVLMEGIVLLSSSSLSFINCRGGTNTAGSNVGVFWEPGLFTSSPDAKVSFDSITGGKSGIGGGGQNYGVQLFSAISLGTPGSEVAFTNITGGDAGNGTNSNSGVFIGNLSAVSASTVIANNVTGGAAGSNNYGFQVAGTLGDLISPQNINITAAGGVGSGNNNTGIFVASGGAVETDTGGLIVLTGTGGGTGGSAGGNHGIQFANGSTLTAAIGAASTITLVGAGGKGTVGNDGVVMQGAVTLNSSPLSFLGCMGGAGSVGGNIGVVFAPTAFTATSGPVSFFSISGGTGGGSNYGVEISGVGIPFTVAPSAITFFDITGGDAGNATSNNVGVFINSGAVVSAGIVSAAAGITGGAALSNNYGFEVAGTLGSTTLAQHIVIKAFGGAGTGNNNTGIFVASGGTLETGPIGSIALTGSGNTLPTSTGANHGIQFAAGSTLTATSGGASTIALTGTGGNGTAGNDGVLIQGAVNVNSSSLSLINCTGGAGSAGGNIGAFVGPTAFAGTSGSVSFTSILGGTGGGSNFGAEISGAGLPFSAASSAISFDSVKGGDSGNGTASNHGVIISGGTVTAETITNGITPILSGAGTNTNIGFYVTGGATLGSGITQTLLITAASLGIGTGEVGIQVDGGSQVTTVGGTSDISFTGYSNLYGISITDPLASISTTNGNIFFTAPSSSIFFGNGITVQSLGTGDILAIADVSIVETGGATIAANGGNITLVSDNAAPVSVAVGLGLLSIPNLNLTTTGGAALKLYGGVEYSGTFPSTINGTPYVSGLNQAQPIYFPAGSYPPGSSYFIYYKNSVTICPPCPSPSPTPAPVIVINPSHAINDFSIAIAEAFQDWRNNWYGDYLDDDRYADAYTPKGMNIVIPSLMSLKPTQQQHFYHRSTKKKGVRVPAKET